MMKKEMKDIEIRVRNMQAINILTSSLNIGEVIREEEVLESDAPTRSYGKNGDIRFRN